MAAALIDEPGSCRSGNHQTRLQVRQTMRLCGRLRACLLAGELSRGSLCAAGTVHFDRSIVPLCTSMNNTDELDPGAGAQRAAVEGSEKPNKASQARHGAACRCRHACLFGDRPCLLAPLYDAPIGCNRDYCRGRMAPFAFGAWARVQMSRCGKEEGMASVKDGICEGW